MNRYKNIILNKNLLSCYGLLQLNANQLKATFDYD